MSYQFNNITTCYYVVICLAFAVMPPWTDFHEIWQSGSSRRHDSFGIHTSAQALTATRNAVFELLRDRHPSYSTDLSSSDLYLFPKLKKRPWTDGNLLTTMMLSAPRVARWRIKIKKSSTMAYGPGLCRITGTKCISVEGNYVEKWQNILFITVTGYEFSTPLVVCAVLRSHVVCLSVCPSVTLVICDHIDWKSWKLIAWAISPTSSLFVFAAKRRSTYSQENMEKFWGD